jgi:hydrogenase/urease accessory protein HupE
MRSFAGWALALALLVFPSRAIAHPVPFSYVDIRLERDALEVTVVMHVFDVAHELNVEPPEALLDGDAARARADTIQRIVLSRLSFSIDGQRVDVEWSGPDVLADRQSLRFRGTSRLARAGGVVNVRAALFPYDPAHQTFLNVYEDGRLATQAILDRAHGQFDYFTGTRQGVLAVIWRFLRAGFHHILIGPDHLLFLVGLLLLGGTFRRLLVVVTAFTLAHSLTLSLAALNIVTPPARIIEPAIALSIVYVGIDNLLVREGRDVRAWIAFAFGFIHGFGFANVLREMEVPARALGWSLGAFNVGVELGQIVVVVVVAGTLTALRSRSPEAGRRLAFAGSCLVIAAGAFWFVQRTFFPGGWS